MDALRRQGPQPLIEFFKKRGWKTTVIEKALKAQEFRDDYGELDVYREVSRHLFEKANAKAINGTFYEMLMSTGFKKAHAKRLYTIIKPLLEWSFSYDQLFDKVIAYTLGWNDPIKIPKGTRFLHNDHTRGQWFVMGGNIYAMNLSGDSTITNVRSAISVLVLINTHKDETPIKLLFHATSWKSCESIKDRGILLGANRPCHDFGIHPSFYTTPTIGVALEYVQKSSRYWNGQTCVLIFKWDGPQVKENGFEIKEFKSVDVEWKRTVKSSRLCEVSANELDEYDFVSGPMVSNPNQVRNSIEEPKTHKPPKVQVAVKEKRAAMYVRKNLIGILYFIT